MRKVVFTQNQIEKIKNDYLINQLSCSEIGKKYSISKRPINRLLSELNLLRKGKSDGKKIELTSEKKELIKRLYVDEKKNTKCIAGQLNLNINFIDKIIQNSGYRRGRGESISLRQTGKKRTERVKMILKTAQQLLVKSGKRKQTGGICQNYIIGGIECQGTYEKFFIERLISENKTLPKNSKSINTPFGVYYPDFEYSQKLIEIKSEYTYEIMIGEKVNRFTKKIDTTQYEKIKWVNENIKPVDIIVIDKRNNKLIKKEIE